MAEPKANEPAADVQAPEPSPSEVEDEITQARLAAQQANTNAAGGSGAQPGTVQEPPLI